MIDEIILISCLSVALLTPVTHKFNIVIMLLVSILVGLRLFGVLT